MKNIRLWDVIMYILGCILFGLSVNVFISPSEITMGGFTGVATTVNHFLPVPIGVLIIFLNAPLLIFQLLKKGVAGGPVRGLLGIVGTSAAVDIMTLFPEFRLEETPLLQGILGGLMMGVGSGILLARGFTTGGSDLLAIIIRPLFHGVSTAGLILYIDAIIIVGSAAVLYDWTGILYSLAAVGSYSIALDKTLSGEGSAVLALVVSKEYEALSGLIASELSRGVTLLSSVGWYTRSEGKTVMCVVKKRQLYRLRQLVKSADASAFVIVCSASQVFGEGFAKDEYIC